MFHYKGTVPFSPLDTRAKLDELPQLINVLLGQRRCGPPRAEKGTVPFFRE